MNKFLTNSRGAIAVTMAVTIVVLLAFSAGAIDLGHALVARNELQNISDSAALAGTRALGVRYEGMTYLQQQNYTLTAGDHALIVAAVQTAANANTAAGVPITINAADIQIGLWDPVARILTPTVNQPRAVRVTARRDGSANGSISTFLAGIIGMAAVNVSAAATAEMTSVGSVAQGQFEVPFAISEFYFTQYGCGDNIKFYPNDGTPQACSAWHTFDQSPSNANTLRSIIDGIYDGSYQSPESYPGDGMEFINGNVASAFPNLITLYQSQMDANGYWDIFVPVYESPACDPPSGTIPIIGYAAARIYDVQGSPNHSIHATIQCNIFEGQTTGGGPIFGPVLSTIPGLVE